MKWFWNTRPARPLRAPQKWVPILGKLQKTLQKGEHLPLRPMPMFESNFVQVTDIGSPVFLHHRANRVTMGVAASLPSLMLPDLLLMACPQARSGSHLELTRIVPLDCARLYVHDVSARRLKLRLVTGRCYYLDLDAPEPEVAFLFDCWVRLAHLLQEPAAARYPRPVSPPGRDVPLATAPASTWCLQDLTHSSRTATVVELPFPQRLTVQKPRKAKRRFTSRAVGDSVPLIWPQQECADLRKKSMEKRSTPRVDHDRCAIQAHDPGKASITIRTIFSVISSTIQQACTPDSEEVEGREGLIATPSRCVSRDSRNLSPLGSCDSLGMLLWQQDIEDFVIPESSALSSSCSVAASPSPDKARHMHRWLGQQPPHSQKTQSRADPQRGSPVTRQQPQRISAVPAPSRKPLAVSAGPQKSLAAPCPSQKATAVLSPHHRPLPQTWTGPPAGTGPQKAMCPPAPEKEPLPLPRSSQQMPAPHPCAQAAPSHPVLREKCPAQLYTVLAGPRGADVMEKSKSEGTRVAGVLVGTQEMNVTEIRTQKASLDLPCTTTTKSQEVLLSQTQVTLGESRGQAKSEDTAHRRTGAGSLGLAGVKPRCGEQQQKSVRTQQVALRAPERECSRAFSVEGLMMAKLMIMANSREQCWGPPQAPLSSWLLATSQAAAVSVDDPVSLPLNPSQLSLLERTQVVVRGQPESCPWGKEKTQRQTQGDPIRGSRGPSQGPLISVPGSDSPMVTADPLVPIPLPASLWEDLPQPPLPPASSLGAKAPARVPQQLSRAPQGPSRVPRQHPAAKTVSSSEGVLPTLLEIQSMRDTATKAQMTKGDLEFLHPLASLLHSQYFQ
ncbi:protein FAM71E2 [Octodon degus]|uniref:Protein FAM71E2 n=1 Tax=Octodon degus TaxID=10160 RepID=A0A6P6DUQ4_OCTDE|nr:protein FAM71E2 [Octodon degus]